MYRGQFDNVSSNVLKFKWVMFKITYINLNLLAQNKNLIMKKHDYFRLLYMVDRQLTFNQLIYAMLLCFVIMLSLAWFKYELHSCMF